MEKQKRLSASKDLINEFTRGIKLFIEKIERYFETSWAIFIFQSTNLNYSVTNTRFSSDSQYARVVFEFLLIFLFLTNLFSIGQNLDEPQEVLREVLVLILFVVEVIVVVGIARVWCFLFKPHLSSRYVKAMFIYEYTFLYFPSYIIVHLAFIKLQSDEEALGIVSLITGFAWLLHLIYYFYRLARKGNLSVGKSIMSVLLTSGVFIVFLFIVLFVTVGLSDPEV